MVGRSSKNGRVPQEPLVAVRREVARLRESLDRLEAEIRRLESGVAPQSSKKSRSRPERYYAVLVGVYEHGRFGIDAPALAELAEANGYDRRGLNGFFAGARAPLQRDGERVVLTAEGHRLIEEHLRGVAG